MKKRLFLFALLVAGTCVARPRIICAVKTVTLTPETAEIVVPNGASPIVRYAGCEATNYLSRILGVAIPLVASPTAGKVSVVLGEVGLKGSGGTEGLEGLARDTFVIKAVNNRIYIAGQDDPRFDLIAHMKNGRGHGELLHVARATLFGVYDFLEQHAGCRFYYPGELGEVVPKKGRIEIPAGVRTVTPNFLVREPYFGSKARWPGEGADGKNRSRIVSELWLKQRLSSASIPCCHGSRNFKYIDRFGKTRPDFLALKQNGTRWLDPKVFAAYQYCWANPDFQEEFYQDIKAYLTGQKPETRGLKSWGPGCRGKYVDIMPEDSFEGCFCDFCQKAYVRKPGDRHYATELMWGLTDKLARRLTAEGIDGRLTMMSYPPYGRIPDFDLAPNIDVMVATTGPWLLAKPQDAQKADATVRGWAKKLGHRVWVWTYPHKWGATAVPGLPSFGPRAWGRYFHGMQDAIFGSFAESETENGFYNHLNYYLFSRVGWDRNCDPDAVVDEYYRLMFGSAECEMKEFFDTLERKWVYEIAGNVEQTAIGPVAAPPTTEQLWTKVYSPAVRAHLAALLTAGKGKVAAGSLESRRIDLMKAEFYDGLETAAKTWEAEAKTTRAFVYDASCGKPLVIGRTVHGVFDVNAKPSVETRVTIRKTETSFIVDFDCEEPKMGETLALERKPDEVDCWRDNGAEFFINASDDGKTVYHFILTSKNILADAKLDYHGAKASGDWGWNSGAQHSVERTTRGWKAHFDVPLSSLPWMREKFRANFCRNRVLKGMTEFSMWSKYAKGYQHLEKFGWIIVK